MGVIPAVLGGLIAFVGSLWLLVVSPLAEKRNR
jgi:hypothetical protein